MEPWYFYTPTLFINRQVVFDEDLPLCSFNRPYRWSSRRTQNHVTSSIFRQLHPALRSSTYCIFPRRFTLWKQIDTLPKVARFSYKGRGTKKLRAGALPDGYTSIKDIRSFKICPTLFSLCGLRGYSQTAFQQIMFWGVSRPVNALNCSFQPSRWYSWENAESL